MTKSFRSAGIYVLSLALTAFALAIPLVAAGDTVPPGKLAVLELDPAKTTITYSLDGWPHHTQGTFKLKRGVVEIDPSTGKMSGTITVNAASGDSGHSIRDGEMKSTILEVDRFPEITFAPRQVLSHGDPQKTFPVKVVGLMLLHGAQHALTIEATVEREENNVTIHSDFPVPFVEWGLRDPSLLMFKVSKQVLVDVTANARLSWVASTSAISAAMPTAVPPLAASGSASLQSKAQ
jgi:polyisoprenoid-binding protein YceI